MPEYESVEAFVEFLLAEERASYTVQEAHDLSHGARIPLPEVHRELRAYGLALVRREPPRRVRGFTSNDHDRWYGPGASRTHGGSGATIITGFVGNAAGSF